MKLFSELKRVSSVLLESNLKWALCGGIVASIYRDAPRFTSDIDILLLDSDTETAKNLATTFIKKLGYEPIIGFVPDIADRNKQIQGLICCREESDDRFVGVDFLLPVAPWMEPAVVRAQGNLVDYGFAKLPTITIEDFLISKIVAITGNPDRPYDKDDILACLKMTHDVDKDYMLRQLKALSLNLPEWIDVKIP